MDSRESLYCAYKKKERLLSQRAATSCRRLVVVVVSRVGESSDFSEALGGDAAPPSPPPMYFTVMGDCKCLWRMTSRSAVTSGQSSCVNNARKLVVFHATA
ncbi:unnamed protein product [Trichogramma brassicae]|uniref:Uncharacterized protein n=1 Tax=Trichogramma brassicae TaxID=86971 RepID=A0A6H5ICT8_9HYME|nr:unnamed protein product [Trichogramma brassicae]